MPDGQRVGRSNAKLKRRNWKEKEKSWYDMAPEENCSCGDKQRKNNAMSKAQNIRREGKVVVTVNVNFAVVVNWCENWQSNRLHNYDNNNKNKEKEKEKDEEEEK